MNFKNSRRAMLIGFVIGIFIMIMGIGLGNEKTIASFMVVGTIIFALALVQAFIFYICPYCKGSLMNVRGGIPKHCPHCGKELEEDLKL